ncbi:DUF2917 domain-containing protein [uncultured Desulfosarcina sp.]|uniref:DUF2917 domain-containing protein n=1 Tax=uncultured Desulfosarcina sp. TaxID=218289 RepID=UPI0029C892CD|nr:DUF2917 domain-containing protein [uncultured Desulfosarcina sp.]
MNHQFLDSGSIMSAQKRFFLSNLSTPDTLVDLAAGQGWGLKGKRRQQTLFCLQGSVWVTQECDIHDYVLEEGDAFLVTQPGLVLVRALTPARIGYAESLMPMPFKGRFSQTVFN